MEGVRQLRKTDWSKVGDESGIDTGPESLVQQQFRTECDVNTIVRRFGMVGSEALVGPQGVYGDFTGISDYESAVEAVNRAQAGFMALPAVVRERFGNDPARFLDWSGGRSLEEIAAGLSEPAAPVAPAPVPAVGPEGGTVPPAPAS